MPDTAAPSPKRTAKPPRSGRCRICGCTWARGCPEGCEWTDRSETLCSVCNDAAENVHTVIQPLVMDRSANVIRLILKEAVERSGP